LLVVPVVLLPLVFPVPVFVVGAGVVDVPVLLVVPVLAVVPVFGVVPVAVSVPVFVPGAGVVFAPEPALVPVPAPVVVPVPEPLLVPVVLGDVGATFEGSCLAACPRLRPSTVIAFCRSANAMPRFFDALSAAMNWP
jgi:hypothetical protein